MKIQIFCFFQTNKDKFWWMIWYNKKTLALELFWRRSFLYNFFGIFVIHTICFICCPFNFAIFQTSPMQPTRLVHLAHPLTYLLPKKEAEKKEFRPSQLARVTKARSHISLQSYSESTQGPGTHCPSFFFISSPASSHKVHQKGGNREKKGITWPPSIASSLNS